jgi:hypothetical protein
LSAASFFNEFCCSGDRQNGIPSIPTRTEDPPVQFAASILRKIDL